MPIQIGYCNGHNHLLNAVEYHRDSEINIAVTDLILILGKEQDITEDHTYDSSKMEAFLIPAGTTIEVYATTLHYAPCNVAASGFKCVVVLPKGTNTDITLEEKHTPEDDLLFARNKWLLSHPDANIAGSVAGIKGENLLGKIKPRDKTRNQKHCPKRAVLNIKRNQKPKKPKKGRIFKNDQQYTGNQIRYRCSKP